MDLGLESESDSGTDYDYSYNYEAESETGSDMIGYDTTCYKIGPMVTVEAFHRQGSETWG